MEVRLSGIDALRQSMANRARAWQGGKDSARDRILGKQYFPISHNPKFTLGKSDKIFTVGSCFAREIEFKLAPFGVPLLLFNKGVERKHFASWTEADDAVGANRLYTGVFNKYTTASIEHDIRRTILNERYENEGLIEIDTDKWFDPHASGLKLLPLDIALENRAKISAAMNLIREADVVVLTLGQTESWIDCQSGIAMNAHPGPPALRKFRDRFAFIVHTYRDSIEQLERTIQFIRTACNPDMKIVVTVSPVPFNATFREQDIVVAHQATKAMLRSVAEELFRSHDFLDYFPSYEMVINTPRELAWNDDQLHVSGEMVKHIMGVFYAKYYPDTEAN